MTEQNYQNRTRFSPRGILRKGSLSLRIAQEAIAHFNTLSAPQDFLATAERSSEDMVEDTNRNYEIMESIVEDMKRELDAAETFLYQWFEGTSELGYEDITPKEIGNPGFASLMRDDDNPKLLCFEGFAQHVYHLYPLEDDKWAYNARFATVPATTVMVGYEDRKGEVYMNDDGHDLESDGLI